MTKRYSPLDMTKNEIQNAVVQVLSADPSSPVIGQIYYNSTDQRLKQYTGVTNGWIEYGTGAGAGDVSSNTATSVDGEAVVFNGTTGKSVKRATGSGVAKLTNGVLGVATAGNDYVGPTTGSSVQKANGSGGLTAATQGTDYYAPGGTDVAVADGGTGASSLTGVLKGNGTSPVTGSATLNDVAAPTADFSMASHKVTNVTDPTSAQDAATKNYVDGIAQGISWKNPVRAVSTANITLSGTQTIDGVAVVAGDRVLVAGQTTASANGIYVVAAGAWSRATDADNATELLNATVLVEEGTAYADTAWTGTANAPLTVGTTLLPFVQVNGGTVPAASTSTAGKVQLATQAEAEAKSDTGKAVTSADLVNFPIKKAFNVGDGSSTNIALTHSLGTRDVIVQVYDAATYMQIDCDITMTSTSVVTLGFTTAPASNAFRAVIMG